MVVVTGAIEERSRSLNVLVQIREQQCCGGVLVCVSDFGFFFAMRCRCRAPMI